MTPADGAPVTQRDDAPRGASLPVPPVPAPSPVPAGPRSRISQDPYPEPSPQDVEKEHNPFSDPDWRMLTYAWTGYVLRLLLVLGAAFSVYQFLLSREEKRVERTLALVELWERPEYLEARKAVTQRITELNARYEADFKALGQNPAPKAVTTLIGKLGKKAMEPDGGSQPLSDFRDQFDRVVYLLNRVSSCVASDLCSSTVADDYFRDYAQSFWTYFADFVREQRRNGSKTFAKPIETYVLSGQADAVPAPQ